MKTAGIIVVGVLERALVGGLKKNTNVLGPQPGGAVGRGSGATKDWRCFLDGVEVVGRGGLRPPEMEQAGGAKFLELAPPSVACCR